MPISDKYWDKTAERYAKSPVSDEATYQRKISETQEFLEPHMRIIEFGCGTGTTAVAHAPHVEHIDAVDVSENMLEIGRGKAKDANIKNISFNLGTLQDLKAESASVDAVLGLNVIHLIEDRQAVFTEVARVLKPGGFFVTSTVCVGASKLRFITWLLPLTKLIGLTPDFYVLREGWYCGVYDRIQIIEISQPYRASATLQPEVRDHSSAALRMTAISGSLSST